MICLWFVIFSFFQVGTKVRDRRLDREKTEKETYGCTQSAGQISLFLLRNIDLMPDKVSPMRVPRKPKTPSSSSRLLGKSSGYAVDICGRRILGSNGRIFCSIVSNHFPQQCPSRSHKADDWWKKSFSDKVLPFLSTFYTLFCRKSNHLAHEIFLPSLGDKIRRQISNLWNSRAFQLLTWG